jgi:hypothetical protein
MQDLTPFPKRGRQMSSRRETVKVLSLFGVGGLFGLYLIIDRSSTFLVVLGIAIVAWALYVFARVILATVVARRASQEDGNRRDRDNLSHP